MLAEQIKKHADKIRFMIVGGANTAIDFTILFALVNFLNVPLVISQIISTSTALIFSFFVNKKFTFNDKSVNGKSQLIKFLVITLFGLWIIQTIIIAGIKFTFAKSGINSNIILLIGKLLATCVTLIWNYVLYKKFVFNNKD